jgi:uncharacterized caspase-like protein/predicted nucleotide-binding protein
MEEGLALHSVDGDGVTQRRRALIVANSEYKDPLSRLASPAHDAEKLGQVLGTPGIGDFEVKTLLDQTASVVTREIEDFFVRSDPKPDDLLLLYFSGHGITDEDGDFYFAMLDTEMVRQNIRCATAIGADFVNKMMEKSRCKRQLLVLDCCHSGAFAQSMRFKGLLPSVEKSFPQGDGRILLASSTGRQFSLEGSNESGVQTSVYTRIFVKGLETGEADGDHDGRIEVDELHTYLVNRISKEAPQQTPTKTGKVEGHLYIARAAILKPALSADLQAAMATSEVLERLGAVVELKRLLGGENLVLALEAREALEALKSEDGNARVRDEALDCLASLSSEKVSAAEVERAAAEKGRAAEQARRKRMARDMAEAEHAARQKIEKERLRRQEAMRKPTIFIVSSNRALPLAKQLKYGLESSGVFSEVLFWYQEMQESIGTTIADSLKKATQKSDFVAVVFTDDDARLAHRGDNDQDISSRVLKPWIFEAGFLTGALQMDFGRCFLISSVESSALPSDFQQLQEIRFREPDLKDQLACSEEMKRSVVPRIVLQVRRKGSIDRRPVASILTADELLDLEYDLEPRAVVVHSGVRLETSYRLALKIMDNITKGVIYKYFLPGNPEVVQDVWSLLQMLCIANLATEHDNLFPGGTDTRALLRAVESDSSKMNIVLSNLDLIQRSLRIAFLLRVVPIEFCVHNAHSADHARSYLRYGMGQYIEWYKESARAAEATAQALMLQYLDLKAEKAAVFRSTEGFLLTKERRFTECLHDEIDAFFEPDSAVRKRVVEICFGENVSSARD